MHVQSKCPPGRLRLFLYSKLLAHIFLELPPQILSHNALTHPAKDSNTALVPLSGLRRLVVQVKVPVRSFLAQCWRSRGFQLRMPYLRILWIRWTRKPTFKAFWEDCGVEGLMREVGFVRELGSTDLDDTLQSQNGKAEEVLANKRIAY